MIFSKTNFPAVRYHSSLGYLGRQEKLFGENLCHEKSVDFLQEDSFESLGKKLLQRQGLEEGFLFPEFPHKK